MIFIHLGFPKTSTTNLQKNLFPKLKKISYLGRKYHENNSKLFKDLCLYVEGRKIFSKEELQKLSKQFIKVYNINKNMIISNENWLCPYQIDNETKKPIIYSKEKQLRNLINFLKQLGLKYTFFIFIREKKEIVPSYYVTLNYRITSLFGKKFSKYSYFLDYIYKKKKIIKNYYY